MGAGGPIIVLEEVFRAIFPNNHIFLSAISIHILVLILTVECLSIGISRFLGVNVFDCSLQAGVRIYAL